MINWQDQVRNGALSSGTAVPSADPGVQWARYLRTTTGVIYVWTGAAWVEEAAGGGGGGGGATVSDATPQVVGTAAAGVSADASRADHVHATGAGTPSTQAFGDSATIGSGPNAAMEDHKHAMPALGTTPAASAPGDAQAGGAATTASKNDHVHAREAFGTTAAAIGTSAGGSATTPSKSDHVHATGAGTPSTQAFGDAAATGTGPAAAMTDHKHAMPANPVTAHEAASDPHTGYLKESAAAAVATSGAYGDLSGTPLLNHAVCQGRLTLTTAVPVTTGDVTAAATLYFTPYRGNRIGTYSGSAWSVSSFAEKSITLASLTANSNYDVFIVDGTLALELLIWTDGTTRATALALQDGVYVKSGATTRRYLGTIRILATGQCEDSVAHRFVWNQENRVRRALQVIDGTDNWTHNAATWRAANNTTTNHQIDYVCGLAEDAIRCFLAVRVGIDTTEAGAVGIGVDSTSAFSGFAGDISGSGTGFAGGWFAPASYLGVPGLGYHYFCWLEYARSGTITFWGDGGVADSQSGIQAEVLA